MDKIVSWLGKLPHDKALHSVYGTIVYMLWSWVAGPIVGILVTLGVAVVKEMWDKYSYGGWDWKDIGATVAIALVLAMKDMYAG